MFKKLIVLAVFAFVGLGLVSTQAPKTVNAATDKKVTICHATNSHSNPYTINKVSKSSVDEPGNKYLNGHGDHTGPVWYQGVADHSWGDIIPPFSYTKQNGQTINYPGYNWNTDGRDWYNNSCQKPGTTPIDFCDTTQVKGSVASWLAKNDINGADCFDYAVEQSCGNLNVTITEQPEPQYPQGPYSAVYTTNGQVTFPATAFPATFPEDYNGGSVDVTWFTVGPEGDWLKGFDFPNFWGGVGQTITVDTDCEDENGVPTPTPLTPTSTDVEEEAQVEAPVAGVNAGSGETATIVTAAVALISSLASLAYGVVRFTKFGA